MKKNNGTITKLVIRLKKLANDAETYFNFWTKMRLQLQKKLRQMQKQNERNRDAEFNLQQAIRQPPKDPIDWVVERIITLEGKKLSKLTRLFIEDKENPFNSYLSELKIDPSYETEFVQKLNRNLVRYGYIAAKTVASNRLEERIERKIYEIHAVQYIDLTKVQRRARGKWGEFEGNAKSNMKALFETFKEEERNKTAEQTYSTHLHFYRPCNSFNNCIRHYT